MAFDQQLFLAQTLKLSPTLLQSMHILQMNTQDLSDYLNDMALENPAMEYDEGPKQPSWAEFTSRIPWLADTHAPGTHAEISADIGSVSDHTDSLELFLQDQLSRLALTSPLLALCQYLAADLDEHGRLDPSTLAELTKAGVPEDLLAQAVSTLQSLDPPGIAARSLSECLILQLERLPGKHTLAIQLCDHLDLVAKERYALLAKELSCTKNEILEAIHCIQSLNPNPLIDLPVSEPIQYVRPDAWVAEIDGQLQVFVNQWDLPQFHLSNDYLRIMKDGQDEDAAAYLRQKIQQAQWVLQCVQRRNETLEACVRAIVDSQADFFLGQSDTPGPLLRRDLAVLLEVHPSTVTRTLRHKYIQCRQGLFPTSYFFSRTTGGAHSEQALKARIARLIREEDPKHPLSDQDISDCLAQEGITLARRTVAKYRLAVGLPPSYQRRHS